MKITDPGETQQEQGKDMVGEHLPKVLPLDIKELRDQKRPVESRGKHIIPPNARCHTLSTDSKLVRHLINNTTFITNYLLF